MVRLYHRPIGRSAGARLCRLCEIRSRVDRVAVPTRDVLFHCHPDDPLATPEDNLNVDGISLTGVCLSLLRSVGLGGRGGRGRRHASC